MERELALENLGRFIEEQRENGLLPHAETAMIVAVKEGAPCPFTVIEYEHCDAHGATFSVTTKLEVEPERRVLEDVRAELVDAVRKFGVGPSVSGRMDVQVVFDPREWWL